MIIITIGNRNFKAPTSWAECPRAQAEALAMHSPQPTEGDYSRAFKESLVKAWLRCDDKFWQKLTIQPHEFHFLWQQCQWIMAPASEIKLSFECMEHAGTKYYLPEYGYKTSTAIEIAWANVAWMEYVEVAEPIYKKGQGGLFSAELEASLETALNTLLSIILRPIRQDIELCLKDARWNGDKRVPLANHICEQIEKELANLPPASKNLALRYFEKMNADFINEFGVLFNPAENTGEATAIAPKYPQGFGWEAALRRIAKEGTFGNYEQVCQTNGRQIWLWEYQKHLELEAEIANAKLAQEKNK